MNSGTQDTEMSEEMEVLPTETEQNYEPSVINRVIHFRVNKEKYAVSCKPSMTVLEALKRSKRFRGIQLKNRDKEIVIQREKFPKAVVNTGFPCSLIDEQETLDVSFIKGEAPSQVGETALDHPHTLRAEDLVSFNIRTKGGKNIRQIMKNQELKLELDFVCVHAKRGENLRKALKRDGRFTDVIFRKRCALIELESEVITEMSNAVDHLDGKHLQVIRFDDSALLVNFKATGSRKVSRTMSDVSDTAPCGSQTENPRKLVRTKPRELAKTSLKSMDVTAVLQACKMIPNSEELFKTLSTQCRCLLNEMKKHSRLKSYKDLLRVEYDKGKRGFSKISDVKRLMQLSDSVCKIIIDGEPNGTGFLLFDKFILTCAHVIDCEPRSKPRKLKDPVTAEFDYEDNKTKQVFQVKEDIVSCSHEVEGEGPFLDFALLELGELIPQAGGSVKSAETAESTPPALLKGSTSSAKTKVTKSICIIGHPDCLSKKYDVCSVIRDDKWKSTTNDRLSQMTDKVLHILSELSLEDDWNYNSSQITYDTCFFDGSSGSPVFNKRCELIGIHTGGYAYEDSKNKFRSLMEYGFPIGPVLKRIMIQSRERGRNDVLTILESLVIQQDTLDSPTDKDFHTTPLNPVIKSAQDKRDNITDKTPKLNLS